MSIDIYIYASGIRGPSRIQHIGHATERYRRHPTEDSTHYPVRYYALTVDVYQYMYLQAGGGLGIFSLRFGSRVYFKHPSLG